MHASVKIIKIKGRLFSYWQRNREFLKKINTYHKIACHTGCALD